MKYFCISIGTAQHLYLIAVYEAGGKRACYTCCDVLPLSGISTVGDLNLSYALLTAFIIMQSLGSSKLRAVDLGELRWCHDTPNSSCIVACIL